MEIRCIDNKGIIGLSIGSKYSVLKLFRASVSIKNDRGVILVYSNRRFITSSNESLLGYTKKFDKKIIYVSPVLVNLYAINVGKVYLCNDNIQSFKKGKYYKVCDVNKKKYLWSSDAYFIDLETGKRVYSTLSFSTIKKYFYNASIDVVRLLKIKKIMKLI